MFGFDEGYYLSQNPDVAAAIRNGTFASAEQHFALYGQFEGRDPNAQFDVSYYFAENPDVLAAAVRGQLTALEHFARYGVNEDNRLPNETLEGFDSEAYLAANPDVAAAITAGTFTSALQHFLAYGQAEMIAGTRTTTDGVPAAALVPPTQGLPGQTFTLTTAIGDNFSGTTGNDVFNAILGTGATLNAFDAIDGKGGTDTLNILTSGVVAIDASASIKGIEIVNYNLSGDASANTVNAESFTGVQQIWQIGENKAAGVENVGESTTVGFRSSTELSTVEFAGTKGTVALDNVATAQTLTIDGDDVASVTVSGTVAAANATTAGTLKFAEADAGTEVTTLNLSLTSAATVNVNGLGDLETLNASGSKAALTLGTDAGKLGFADVTDLKAVTLGSGNDALTLTTAGKTAETITVDLGAGNDTLTLTGANNTANTAVNITLGAGNDTLVVSSLANVTAAADFQKDMITVLDFNAAQDVLDLSALGGANGRDVLVNTELANIAQASTLKAAIDLAAAATTAGEYSVFNYGGDAYVYVNAAAPSGSDPEALAAGDGLIKIVGFSAEAITATNFIA